MPIKLTTPQSKIDKYIKQQLIRQERALLNTLMYVGQECVNAARTNDSYTDQTGNLRSSIGYVVAVDGKVIGGSSFDVVKGGAEGGSTGKAYATEIVSHYPKSTVLIVVAGMHYAEYVAATGRDVIASAELKAQELIPKLLKQLENQINHANG